MKTVVVGIGLLWLLAAPAAAQPMPNRSAEVAQVVQQPHVRGLFGSEDGRRQILAWIAAALNPADGSNWGLLRKMDVPGGRVPADILVWRPTLEHVDVLTDTGPAWIQHPRIELNWVWEPAPPVGLPPPVPAPPPTGSGGTVPTPPGTGASVFDAAEIVRRQMVLENELLIIKAEGRETQAITADAVREIKEHRAGVQNVWLKVAAVGGPLVTGLLTWWKLRATPAAPASGAP